MALTNEVTVKMKCDNPDCIVHLEWNMEEVKTKPEGLPDGAYRIVLIVLFNEQQQVFCSNYCAATWLRKHTPLKSPAEKAREMAGQVKEIREAQADAIIEQVSGPGPAVAPESDGTV